MNGVTANITTVNATTVDATNVEVTNVKAKDGTAAIVISNTSGNVGIGGAAAAGRRLDITGTLPEASGFTIPYNLRGTIPSTATTVYGYYSTPTTEATSFTLTSLNHFFANPPAFGAGSTVTNQYGFIAGSTLTGATNNYGFYSNIASGTGRFNFYANGTAVNYMAGRLGIGITAPLTLLHVSTSAAITAVSGNADEAIFERQGAAAGITIASGNASTGNVYFADQDLNTVGRLVYDHATDQFQLWTNNAQRLTIDSSGNVGIGSTSLTQFNFRLSNNITGNASSQAIRADGTIQSGVTTEAVYVQARPSTVAASFTLTDLASFAVSQGTFGASSAVTNQYGFRVDSSLTGATNNYGFYSAIASGSNRWNFYAAGTAQNYMAGRLGINNTTFADSEMLRVTQANANTGAIIDVTASSSTGSAGLRIRKFDNDNTTAQTYIAFDYNNGASGAGGIQGNGGTGPQFYNSSDARFKENVADLDGQLAKILALKPRKFDFINGPKDCTGFIAQEMETVYPDVVGEDSDGFKIIGGISVMEARLIKAIQELTARVAELEAK
jgi:hypothetical protein